MNLTPLPLSRVFFDLTPPPPLPNGGRGLGGLRARLKTELPGLPRSQAPPGNACREALPPLLGHRSRA